MNYPYEISAIYHELADDLVVYLLLLLPLSVFLEHHLQQLGQLCFEQLHPALPRVVAFLASISN